MKTPARTTAASPFASPIKATSTVAPVSYLSPAELHRELADPHCPALGETTTAEKVRVVYAANG
jgi:hypothetical protein